MRFLTKKKENTVERITMKQITNKKPTQRHTTNQDTDSKRKVKPNNKTMKRKTHRYLIRTQDLHDVQVHIYPMIEN